MPHTAASTHQPPLPWLLLACLLFPVGPALFAANPQPVSSAFGYVTDGHLYREIWWREYRSDEATALLLHFNRPRSPAWARPGDRKIAAETEPANEEINDLFSDALDEEAGDAGPAMADSGLEVEQSMGRDRDEVAPEGAVYDYSPNELLVELPKGIAKTEDGRFDGGLAFSGEAGLRLLIGKRGSVESMEGWFHPEQLPEEEPVGLLASRADGARLLLRPDGHVELQWRWNPSRKDRPWQRLRSEEPIEPGEWTHIAVYDWRPRHVDEVRGHGPQIRLGINGRVSASAEFPRSPPPREHFMKPGVFFIGQRPDGGGLFTGRMDEIRVASRRRYVKPTEQPWLDPERNDPVNFGPPAFPEDTRVFHADFESPKLPVASGPKSRIDWDPGKYASFEDLQIDGPYGRSLVIDPALGFPKIPIHGLDPHGGSFEMFIKPMNWDNHQYAGSHWRFVRMPVARFMGRHKPSGRIVEFMRITIPPRSIYDRPAQTMHPGQWSHLIFTWSREDRHNSEWGSRPAGTPATNFKGLRNGRLIWIVNLERDGELIQTDEDLDKIEPRYVELGIAEDIAAWQYERPTIAVDEVIGHDRPLSQAEQLRAWTRWGGPKPEPESEEAEAPEQDAEEAEQDAPADADPPR